jgi:uncharacterized protein
VNRFVVFLSLFLSCYGAMHLYVLIKARRAFYLQNSAYILLLVLLAFLMIAPIQAAVLERQDQRVLSMVMAWIGFIWMGALFIFVCLAVPLDAYHIALAALRRISNQDLIRLMLSRRQAFILLCLATVVLMIYGSIAAYCVRPESITLKSAKIPASMGKLRIVQISDLHVGNMMFPARAASIVKAVESTHPDILVSTGDLVEGRSPFLSTIADAIRAIPAPLGKFAVTGNHEFYMGLERAAAFTRQAGFTLLRNRSVRINDAVTITGVDDPAGGISGPPEHTLLQSLPGGTFTLLLKHRPIVDGKSRGHFDLQLSGHTHRGQIFPFTLVVDMFYPLTSGLHHILPESWVYVQRGTGTWGPPFRIFAPPEITIIDVLPGQS